MAGQEKHIKCRCGHKFRVNLNGKNTGKFQCPKCQTILSYRSRNAKREESSEELKLQELDPPRSKSKNQGRYRGLSNGMPSRPVKQKSPISIASVFQKGMDIYAWTFMTLLVIFIGIGGYSAIGPSLRHIQTPKLEALQLYKGVPYVKEDRTDKGRKYGRYLVFEIGEKEFRSDQRIVNESTHYAIRDACLNGEELEIWTDGHSNWEYSGGRPVIWQVAKDGQVLMSIDDFAGHYQVSSWHALIAGSGYAAVAFIVMPISLTLILRKKFFSKR